MLFSLLKLLPFGFRSFGTGLRITRHPGTQPGSPTFTRRPTKNVIGWSTRIGCNTIFQQQLALRHPDFPMQHLKTFDVDTSFLSASASFSWSPNGPKMFICIDTSDVPNTVEQRHLSDDLLEAGVRVIPYVWADEEERLCRRDVEFRAAGFWILKCPADHIYITDVSTNPWFARHSQTFDGLYNALLPACQPEIPAYVISHGEINAQGKCVPRPSAKPRTAPIRVATSDCLEAPPLKKMHRAATLSDSDEDLEEGEIECRVAAWVNMEQPESMSGLERDVFTPSIKTAYITLSDIMVRDMIQKTFGTSEIDVPGQCGHIYKACAYVVASGRGRDHSVALNIAQSFGTRG